MTLTEYYTPIKLKDTWQRLYNLSKDKYSYFQSYESNVLYYKVFRLKGVRRKYKPVFLYCYSDNQECIVPIIINDKQRIIRNFSSFGPIDYFDIISSSKASIWLVDVISAMMAKYHDYQFIFENCHESSDIYTALQLFRADKFSCVKINLKQWNSYEEYFMSLSKHQRQNIRTAYNKLNNNAIHYKLSYYDADQGWLNRDVLCKCQKMYEERCEIKNLHVNIGKIKRVIIRMLHRFQDPLLDIISSSPLKYGFVLNFNLMPAAYMLGFYSNDKKGLLVPRLACNNEYARYDAGIIMLNEVIKYCYQNGLEYIDLTRGDEPYKISMGGKESYNFTFYF